ncbi:TIGR03619 family F420-dependent LLM class oxidoreductase [Egicoccus halophilus]|uniref:LLM class F420-dependent oxidoreductase n=1 Tax=Egicoccus halophilus TaxID=1670830 RepID=A0A8J3ETU6_9ACTN|nr:TIGR03619 family F420-dependent LLM class oxidoreductase [Egicoccus halophilus]GGI06316.1 LLM class F420-dependent oxidoreductase [Egicoccus halophilus]
MRLGVAIFLTDRTPTPVDLARAVEERGLDHLFVPEHTHMPLAHDPHPSGEPLPDPYRRTLDPFVALAAAAAVTERIELGTGICLVAQRDPIVTAKEVASLDLVSGGRFVLGVGYGWNRPELEAHGVAWADRRDVVRDRLRVLRALWTEDVASVDAPHAQLAPSQAWPKPSRAPHPPVLLGAGLGPRTLADLVDVADGWMPMGASATREGLPRLRDGWERAGRDGSPTVHVYGTRPDLDGLRELAGLGVDAVSLWLPSAGADEVVPALDRIAELRARLR